MSFQFDPRPPNPPDLDYAQLAAGVSPKHDGPETVACTSCGHGARLALRLQALLASRSLVAALRVQYLRVIRYLARQADE